MSRLPLDSVARTLVHQLPRRAALRRLGRGLAAGLLAGVAASQLPAWRAAAQSATPPAMGSAFVVLRRYQLRDAATMDDLVQRVTDGFVPIVSAIAGFREYFFIDAGAGAHLTMSLFDDPAGAEASTRDAADWAAANVAELIEGPPEVTEGWVRVHVTAGEKTETV